MIVPCRTGYKAGQKAENKDAGDGRLPAGSCQPATAYGTLAREFPSDSRTPELTGGGGDRMPRRWILLCLLPLLLAAGVLGAEGAGVWDEPRFYVGGLCANCTVLGDFTGDLYLTDGYQLFAVPEVGNGWGFGGLAGLRMRRLGGEVSYTRSTHVGMWNGTAEFESRQKTVGVDLRIFPLRWGPFEPFALLGACFVKLTVFDGVTDGSVSVDAAYWEIGLDLGGGISLGIGKRLSLVVQAVYHWARYNTVDDVWGLNLTITNGLGGSGYDFSALLLVAL
jgi:hypothetical protein